jgi:hypothetical protein
MGVDQPECGGQQPRKMAEYEHWRKSSKTFDRWDVGCSLVVLKMTCSQSGSAKFKDTF